MLLSPQWMISQLLSYSPLNWLAFVGVAAIAPFRGRWWGIICGHVVVAALVMLLDIDYQGHHAQQMDLDFVFALGVYGRILLINTTLLPISALALWFWYRKRKSAAP